MQAVIYARFSPRPDAAECESLNVQIERCRAYCSINNLHVVEIFKDPEVSARKHFLHQRPDGKRMLDYITDRSIKHIVTLRIDRIFRNAENGMTVANYLMKQGVSLHFADQGGVSLCASTAIGRLVFGMLLSVAEFEPAITAERTSKALRYKSRTGRRVSRSAPFGWRLNPDNPKLTLPDEDEQEVLGIMQDLARSNVPARMIATTLNSQGYRLRESYWSTQRVNRILTRLKESESDCQHA